MRASVVTLAIVSLVGIAGGPLLAAGTPGPLVGKPCPEFPLSHALQGAAWHRDDLLGQVVVLDLFQLG